MSVTEGSSISLSICFNSGSYTAGNAGLVDLKIVLKKTKTNMKFSYSKILLKLKLKNIMGL